MIHVSQNSSQTIIDYQEQILEKEILFQLSTLCTCFERVAYYPREYQHIRNSTMITI